jgi:MYXO-CTERM domain-containing protein
MFDPRPLHSRTACFVLAGLLVALLAPAAAQAQVIKKAPAAGSFKLAASLKGVHPRLHFTTAEIPAIRARGKGASKFFVDRMKKAFGSYKSGAVNVSGSGDWKNYLYGLWGQLAMNLLWIVEQDAAYADTAKAWALHYARDSSWCKDAKQLDDLVPHEIITGIALTYDILYARFSATERAEIRTKLKTLLDLQYPRFFVGQYWTNDFQNNHMHNRISGMGHAAIAILGDDPTIDVQKHADLAYHAYQQLSSWLPTDGSTHEGPGYWDYGYHWITRDEQLFEHVTGKSPAATGHDRETPYFRLYTLCPGMLHTLGFGDTGNTGAAANLEAMLPSIARFKNERAHDFIKQQMKDNSAGFYQQSAWGLLWYDPSVGSKPYTTLPLTHVWPDLDALSARGGWAQKDVGVLFKCGPPGGHLMQKQKVAGLTKYINIAHSHPDQNSFMIWAHGKLLAVDDGYPKDKKLTAAHNTVTIDGVGGPEEGTGWYQPFPYDQTAFMQDVVSSKATAYAGGDASRLYTNGKRFLRHFAFVEGQYVMVIDDLQGKGTTDHTFDWRLHSKGSLTKASAGAFTVTDGTAALDVRILAPAASALTSSFFAKAGTAAPGLSVRTKANATQYLAVLVPQSSGAPSFSADKRAATNGWAIRVAIGGKTDLFAAAAGTKTVSVDDLSASGAAALVRRQGSALGLALLARGTSLQLNKATILGSDKALNLVWRPDATGGQLEVEPPYKGAGVSAAALEVGGLQASAGYCLSVDGVAAGAVSADSQGLAKVLLAVTKRRTVILKQGSGCAAAPDGGGLGDGGAAGDGGMSGDGGSTGDAATEERNIEDGCGCAAAPGGGDLALPGLLLLLALLVSRRRRR